MRITLFALLAISAMVSCRKEPHFVDFSVFKNRYLVCDSMRISNDDSSKTVVLGRGKGYDAKFSGTYTIYSNPVQTFNYADPANIRFSEYKDQQYSKIYFGVPGAPLHTGDFLIIEQASNPHLTLLHKDFRSREQIRYYYTAD